MKAMNTEAMGSLKKSPMVVCIVNEVSSLHMLVKSMSMSSSAALLAREEEEEQVFIATAKGQYGPRNPKNMV